MKIAIIGSRSIILDDIGKYLPKNITEIVSGGARGIDSSARSFAFSKGIKLTEFIPEYNKYGKAAPIKRNIKIIDYADRIIAFWDGTSKGTKFVINTCKKKGKEITVHFIIDRKNNEKVRKQL